MMIRSLLTTATLLMPFAAQAEGPPVLTVGSSAEWGEYVAGPNGVPVYIFATDVRGGDGLPPLESCRDKCEQEWPSVTVSDSLDEIPVGDGIESDLVGTVTKEDLTVVTYDGHPLFYFAREGDSPEPDGHGIHTHGGWWILIEPDGDVKETGIIPEVDS